MDPARRLRLQPQLDSHAVPRPRVLEHLRAAGRLRLTAVVAGPGWGKTVALSRLSAQATMPVVWCQLHPDVGHVAAFALRLVEAIANTFPGFGAGFEEQLGQVVMPDNHAALVARMIAGETEEALAPDWLLLLDDYHLVASEASDRLLANLVELLPLSVHFVLASRRELPPTLTRVSVGSSTSRIDEDDLRLYEAEGVEYLRTVTASSAPAERLAGLVRELEGWPLGLSLLAGHLRANPELARLPVARSAVFDYLSEETLQSESAAMQRLLLTAAVPERFGVRLLASVVGHDLAPEVDEIVRRHLFVTALDDQGEWYRFHHLFRAFLRWKTERMLSADERQRLEASVAAAWHDLGEEQEALRHELAAEVHERAATTLVSLCPHLLASGQIASLRTWLGRLPDDAIAVQPALLVYRATCQFIERRLEECRECTQQAIQVSAATGDDASMARAIELLIRTYAGEDTATSHLQAVAIYQQYRDLFSHGQPPYAQAAAEAASSLADLNRFAEADVLFRWAADHPAGQLQGPILTFSGFYYYLPLGMIDTALAQLQQACDQGRQRDRQNFLPFYLAYLAIALFHIGAGDEFRARARELLTLAEARGMERTFHASMAALLGVDALLAGDREEASRQLAQFEDWQGRSGHAVWGEAWGEVLRAGMAGNEGDVAGFVAGVERALASARNQGSAFRQAQVLLELGRLARDLPSEGTPLAADYLSEALRTAEGASLAYCEARAHLLSAAAVPDDQQARHHLERALQQSRERGYDLLWIQHERRTAASLLPRARAWNIQPDYVDRLQRRLELLTGTTPSSGLRITTLGGFGVTLDGIPVDAGRWGRPKVQLLFKYLLSAPEHRAHREVLMEVLWPDLPPDAARGNLNNAVYRLRRALEPGLDRHHPSRFLVAEGSSYRLVLEGKDQWDASRFLEKAALAQRTRSAEDHAGAAALYGGEYLPDDLYADWASDQAELLRNAYARLLAGWAEVLADQKRWERAIDVGEQLLRFDSTLEAGHRALMRYYLAAGTRDRALRQYRRCEATLRSELDVDPDPETTVLYQSILAE
ncbi:MAG: BTAD domain-containing putative transcriptional regulator [Chloroflexota bacterium]